MEILVLLHEVAMLHPGHGRLWCLIPLLSDTRQQSLTLYMSGEFTQYDRMDVREVTTQPASARGTIEFKISDHVAWNNIFQHVRLLGIA